MDTPVRQASENTRRAIIEAGLRGFGSRGYAATSTREIAALAGTNVASIAYHFGGKEGLRTACAEHIVATMGAVLDSDGAEDEATDAETARRRLTDLMDRMVNFLLLRPEAGIIAGFMVREMAQPSPALDAIYDGLIARVHPRLCRLWADATGRDADSAGVKLAVFGMIGQIVYFHLGRPVVTRRLGWSGIGPAEAQAIAGTLAATLRARLDADRERAT
jgi:AcrR family transcriptional regulator